MSDQDREPDETTPLLSSHEEPSGSRTETMSNQTYFRIAGVYGATAVGLGAFGAHVLRSRFADEPLKLQSWGTAAQYQLIHSVALLVARGNPTACAFFTAGMTLFSGSIYALILDPAHFKFLGPATPIGGLCFIIGWLSLAIAGPGSHQFTLRWGGF